MKRTTTWNILFLITACAILIFLATAPEETTPRLPMDEGHRRFAAMGKKEAERFCTDCHKKEGPAPLPADHPPPYRCLFCHKRGQP